MAFVAFAEDRNDESAPAEPLTEAHFLNTKCDFDVPLGVGADCGALRAPEDWNNPDPAHRVRLAVAVFHSANRNPLRDPIVILTGGPGQGITEGIYFSYDTTVAPFLANRDVIVFDQRGTGASDPSLDCFEMNQTDDYYFEDEFDEAPDEQPPAEPKSTSEVIASQLTAVRECKRRLETAEGANLAHYTTANNAMDVKALRLALGYDRWNLLGVSYGTKLALEVMRIDPEGVRSAVLDSAYPPEVNIYEEDAASLDRALNELFEACAADSRCDGAYEELGESFERVVTRLRRAPVDVVLDPEFDDYTVRVDDLGFVGVVQGRLYSVEAIAYLPAMIDSASKGHFDDVAYAVDGAKYVSSGLAFGMHLSVQCPGELRLASDDRIEAGLDAHPLLRPYFQADVDFTRRACKGWGAEADPIDDEPVVSDIPVLVMAGQFDPVTPPDWGGAVAARMENGFFVELPGLGHAVALEGACPFGIVDAFLARPRTKPDLTCVSQMRPRFE